MKEMNLNWLGVSMLLVCALLVGGFVTYLIVPTEVTGFTADEVNVRISNAVEQATTTKDTEIERLQGLLTEQVNETDTDTDTDETDTEMIGYLIDGMTLNTVLKSVFSDREIKTLFDGEIDFDGKSYDAEETLTIEDISLNANEDDFEGNVYMTVPDGAVEYKFEFENSLNVSKIDEDETLEFNFLGERYEVSEWTANSITLTKGEEISLKPSKTVTINNKTITLELVTNDFIRIEVDGVSEYIDEDETQRVNGLQIKVKDTFASDAYSIAILLIGEEIEIEIDNDDEYEEDSAWEYVITSIENGDSTNSIGLVLTEDFTNVDLDNDEEFQAIGADESFCLPNEYVCIKFNGMIEEETEEYIFELDDDFVRIKGNFEYGTKDYDKIYIDSDGLIYKDDTTDTEDYIGETIKLSNSDLILSADVENGISIYVDFATEDEEELFNINFALSDAGVGDDDIDFLTDYGILVENPDYSVEHNEWTIIVPEEKLEGSISLI